MNYITPISADLIIQTTENQSFKIDWAGFEPFTRGNEPMHIHPKIISKEEFKKFQDFDFTEISTKDSLTKILEKTDSLLKKASKNKKGILISFENESILKSILVIRSLREKISTENKDTKLISFFYIEEKNLEFTPYLSTFEIEYFVCDEKFIPILKELSSDFHINSIDIFGGIPVLENKIIDLSF